MISKLHKTEHFLSS